MIIHSRDWVVVRRHYANRLPAFGPMLELLDWIHQQHLDKELFPHTSMFDLVISDSHETSDSDDYLTITWNAKEDSMLFRYNRQRFSSDIDEKLVSREHSIETLREFLAYKFGIYRKAAEQDAAANP